jgi:hypothetical protein
MYDRPVHWITPKQKRHNNINKNQAYQKILNRDEFAHIHWQKIRYIEHPQYFQQKCDEGEHKKQRRQAQKMIIIPYKRNRFCNIRCD